MSLQIMNVLTTSTYLKKKAFKVQKSYETIIDFFYYSVLCNYLLLTFASEMLLAIYCTTIQNDKQRTYITLVGRKYS